MKSIITSVCPTICAQRCAECINSCLAKRSAAEETSKQTRQHRHSYTAAAPGPPSAAARYLFELLCRAWRDKKKNRLSSPTEHFQPSAARFSLPDTSQLHIGQSHPFFFFFFKFPTAESEQYALWFPVITQRHNGRHNKERRGRNRREGEAANCLERQKTSWQRIVNRNQSSLLQFGFFSSSKFSHILLQHGCEISFFLYLFFKERCAIANQ